MGGMPNSAVLDTGNQIISKLDDFPGFTEEGAEILKNSNLTKNIAEALKEAEENIRAMDAELKLLENEELQFEDNYFPKYNEAKSYLRQTRQALRKLADKTVKEVRDLKVLLEELDESDDTFLLKQSIEKMKDLMISTLETLKEALEKYNLALDTFEKLTSTIRTQNRKLEKLTDKNSAEFKELAIKMRTGLWSTVGATTVGLIIADIFGCLGICSTTGLAISATAIAGAEGGFAKYTAKLET